VRPAAVDLSALYAALDSRLDGAGTRGGRGSDDEDASGAALARLARTLLRGTAAFQPEGYALDVTRLPAAAMDRLEGLAAQQQLKFACVGTRPTHATLEGRALDACGPAVLADVVRAVAEQVRHSCCECAGA
jgi:hypothetical protein